MNAGPMIGQQPLPPPLPASAVASPRGLRRNVAFIALMVLVGIAAFHVIDWPEGLLSQPKPARELPVPPPLDPEMAAVAKRIDGLLARDWKTAGIAPVPRAPDLTVARRLSLALTGSLPSLAEIRRLEQTPAEDRSRAWLEHLLADPRSSAYLAERFARAFVGVEDGPFLVYRRRRLVSWLESGIATNRSYAETVRDMISAEGVWTTRPETNFITVTVSPNDRDEGPDETKLAARLTRAFLGVRIDCVQCHDDMLGGPWKQSDFHQLAAFFAPSEIALTGVRDNPKKAYEFRYLKAAEKTSIPLKVPFYPELLPPGGNPRDRLAAWTTDPRNAAFSRATVNRMWALLFGRALVDPVDSIPLEGPRPAILDALAEDFSVHGHDLRRLIRLIVMTEAFQLDSKAPDQSPAVTDQQEAHWAAFPLSRLRPEQLAGALQQASTLGTIDRDAGFLRQVTAWAQGNDFVKRFGDPGEEELKERPGTISQSLLMMNGQVLKERTMGNPVMNASTRIALMAGTSAQAIETAFLAVFTRRPTAEESAYFAAILNPLRGPKRSEALEDLYWMLLNATEFAWNH